jgi:hypothetical protein
MKKDPKVLIAEAERLMREAEEIQKEEAEDSSIEYIRNMYLPSVPKNFYYDPSIFRRLLGL